MVKWGSSFWDQEVVGSKPVSGSDSLHFLSSPRVVNWVSGLSDVKSEVLPVIGLHILESTASKKMSWQILWQFHHCREAVFSILWDNDLKFPGGGSIWNKCSVVT